MAERVGFEPTVPLRGQRFSRPSESATLAPLHFTRPPLARQDGLFSRVTRPLLALLHPPPRTCQDRFLSHRTGSFPVSPAHPSPAKTGSFPGDWFNRHFQCTVFLS